MVSQEFLIENYSCYHREIAHHQFFKFGSDAYVRRENLNEKTSFGEFVKRKYNYSSIL